MGEGEGGEGRSTIIGHHGWPTTKIKKKQWTGLNDLKYSHKKRNLDKNINDSKSHMSSPFFENIISGIQVVYTRTFQWTLSEFSLISDFLTEILKANKNYWKRSLILQYSFAQKTSLILRISFHLTLKTIYSRNTTKTLSVFTNIPENIFLFSVWNNICTAPFLDAQEPHSWNT